MYCDFNPRLFKEFTSMKVKVKPEMADDWEIILDTYSTTDRFALKSEKLNQQVADIKLHKFLKFSKEQNLTITALALQGNFIIGNDRAVYTEEMYLEWKEKHDKRTEVIIDKKDYIPGHRYKTPCGAEIVYLGYKYISSIKNFPGTTKVTKKYFVELTHGGVEVLKQKFTKDLGLVHNQEEIQKVFNIYSNGYHTTFMPVFQDSKPKSNKLELIRTKRKYSHIFRSACGNIFYSRRLLNTNDCEILSWSHLRKVHPVTFNLLGEYNDGVSATEFLELTIKD